MANINYIKHEIKTVLEIIKGGNMKSELLTSDKEKVLNELGHIVEAQVIDLLDADLEEQLNREIMRAEGIHAIHDEADMDRQLDAYENGRLRSEDL